METIFEFINSEQIPENLPPGEYTTEVISAKYDGGDKLLIVLKYIGEIYNPKNPQCLFMMTKH